MFKFIKNKKIFKKENIFWKRYFLFREIIKVIEKENYPLVQIINKKWNTNYNEKIFRILIEISKKKKLNITLMNKFFKELLKYPDNFNLFVSQDLYDFFCQIGKYRAAAKVRNITSDYILKSNLNYKKNIELILKCSFINNRLSKKYKKFQKEKDEITWLLYSNSLKELFLKTQNRKNSKIKKFFFQKKILILGPSSISNEIKNKEFDEVIRFNLNSIKEKFYHDKIKKSSISYYVLSAIKEIISEKLNFGEKQVLAILRNSDFGRLKKLNTNLFNKINIIRENNFRKKIDHNLNGLARILLDLTKYNTNKIYIDGCDLMISKVKIKKYYSNDLSLKKSKNKSWARGSFAHDALFQYSIYEKFYKLKFFDTNQKLKKILENGLEEYAKELEINRGSFYNIKDLNNMIQKKTLSFDL